MVSECTALLQILETGKINKQIKRFEGLYKFGTQLKMRLRYYLLAATSSAFGLVHVLEPSLPFPVENLDFMYLACTA